MKLETFFENFDLLTDAPNAATKLRELVLQLAVQGKLVEQDPNDEPAEHLLNEAYRRLEEAVKERKIRKSDLICPQDIENCGFLPEGWTWGVLTLAVLPKKNAIKRGPFGSAIKKAYFVPEGFKVYEQKHAIKKDFSLGEYYVSEEKFGELQDFEVLPNDIIISCSGTVGELAIAPRDIERGIINQALLKISIDERVIKNEYFILLFRAYLMKTQTLNDLQGTAQKNITSVKLLKALPFPLPSLTEQKRILEACDRILTLCDKIDQHQQQRHEKLVKMNEVAIAKLLTAQTPDDFDTHWQRLWQNFDLLYSIPETIPKLRQAILQLAVQGKLVEQDPSDEPGTDLLAKIFDQKKDLLEDKKIRKAKSDPVELSEMPFQAPHNWAWSRLNDVILDIEAGTSPLCDKRPKEKGEWGIIKISAISWDVFNPNENKALPIGVEPRTEFEVKVGDFLISRANTSQLVGKSVVVEKTPARLLINDKTLRVHFPKNIEQRFFNLYNNSFLARQYYAEQGTGTSNSMKNINRGQIRNLPVPVPPLAEQKRIVAKVDRLMALCDAMEAKLTAARAQRETLMEAAAHQVLAA